MSATIFTATGAEDSQSYRRGEEESFLPKALRYLCVNSAPAAVQFLLAVALN